MGVQSEFGSGVVCGRGVFASRSYHRFVSLIPTSCVGDWVLFAGLAVYSGGLEISSERRMEQETKTTLNPTIAIIKDKVNTGFVDFTASSGQASQKDVIEIGSVPLLVLLPETLTFSLFVFGMFKT